LKELFATIEKRIAVTCFASNVARIHSVVMAAASVDRHAVLVGRAMHRICEVARENGYLHDLPRFLTEDEAGYLPRDKVVLICTGTQGESRAAMARIANNDHPTVTLQAGDTVIFSAREIPGNERAIARVQGGLVDRGIHVITEADHHVHVSGHPAREEMVEMYQMIRPEIAVPVHGDARHLREHSKLARSCQVPNVVVPGNGSIIRLAPGTPGVIGTAPTASLTIDGGKVRSIDFGPIRERRKMLFNGAATVTVVLDGKGSLRAAPQVSLHGLTDPSEERAVIAEAVGLVEHAILELPIKHRRRDDNVTEAARQAVRRMTRVQMKKRPVTTVHVVRLD
jgi:ribonuclease J